MGIEFRAQDHSYRLNGVAVPSVTQIIKPLYDFSYVNKKVMQSAQDFGTAVHETCDLYDKDDLVIDTLDVNLRPYLDAWIKFKKDFCVKDGAPSEMIVHSELHRYAGTLDKIFWYNKKHYIVDLKTSVLDYRQTRVQLSGYKIAAQEMKLIPRKSEEFTVRLRGDGDYRVGKACSFIDEVCFLSLINVNRWQNEK